MSLHHSKVKISVINKQTRLFNWLIQYKILVYSIRKPNNTIKVYKYVNSWRYYTCFVKTVAAGVRLYGGLMSVKDVKMVDRVTE